MPSEKLHWTIWNVPYISNLLQHGLESMPVSTTQEDYHHIIGLPVTAIRVEVMYN